MKQELKIRIENSAETEQQIKDLNATFVKESHFTDTYFNSPKGNVLKLIQNEQGAKILRLTANNGKFDIVGREEVTDLAQTLAQLSKEHGINKMLKGVRKEYIYNDLAITFNLIDEVGDFLIITGEGTQEQFIKDVLKIENPEYITVPFNEL